VKNIFEGSVGNTPVSIYILNSLEDNYIYVLVWDKKAIAVDPGSADPVIKCMEDLGVHLEAILITHHHEDHIGGISALKKKYDCYVLAPESEHIPDVTEVVIPDDELITGPFVIKVIPTPGHTLDHVSYYFQDPRFLFSGDTLFSVGCGKVFEGTAKDLYCSLQRIKGLNSKTLICPGHEYTEKNLLFALSKDPQNQDLLKRQEEAKSLREKGDPTVPVTLEQELKTNPFLHAKNAQEFAKLRSEKDHFQ